ncbi:hypothetical protein [Nocardiopsis lucentensis]|uniref:hypothetical protein n=1 Tax=Nocardiopsis lucentensis TaxID=53441 RepID=UPI00034C8C61|nr:hypothetical protein [Nocardiopsis lucentensis]
MFDVYCPDCGMTTLLGPRRVLAMHNTEPGVITVELLCYDGHRVTLVTGKRADERDTAARGATGEPGSDRVAGRAEDGSEPVGTDSGAAERDAVADAASLLDAR